MRLRGMMMYANRDLYGACRSRLFKRRAAQCYFVGDNARVKSGSLVG